MHPRRLSTLILGFWLGASLLMTWVATDNFGSVERALKRATKSAEEAIAGIGPETTRTLLRYHSSEQNRRYFLYWGLAQMALGIALALVLLFATNGNTVTMILAAGMLASTGVQRFFIAPQMIEIGRALDFASIDEYREERRAFWNYHRAYTIVELAKLGCGAALALRLLLSSGGSGRRRRSRLDAEIDFVNDPNHSHVDR
jgi:hypothetical protein